MSANPAVAHPSIAETRTEIERLRGIIEGACFFIEEDMLSCAAIILHGMGLDDGTDPTLTDTSVGAALIREHCDERDVIEAARAWAAVSAADPSDEAHDLRAALAKLGDPR